MRRGGEKSGDRLNELATASVTRLLLKYSWPALISMTLNALYAVVDRVFIGQGCGVDAMAGVQLAMPVMMLLGAFGPFIGVGHAAVLSIKLGEGDRTTCEKLLGQVVALKLAIFFVLTPIIFFNLDTILGWCGAAKVTRGTFAAASSYLKIVLFSHLFSHLAFGLSAMQRAEGGAIRSMICMIVGFGTNLVLDPIFIFGVPQLSIPAMGVNGAAWATDIAMLASCLWAVGYYLRGKTVVRLRLRRIWIYPRLLWRSLGIGLAPFLQQLMSSLIVASLSYAFAKWMPNPESRTDQIASLGVFNSALVLVFMPVLGAQQGLQPILGFNWGARNYRRVLATLKTGLAVTTVLTLAAWLIQVVPPFPRWVASLFVSSDNPRLIGICAHDLQLSNCMICCISINVVPTTFFQSIGRPKIAIMLSILRQGVILLPIVWLLPHFLDDKVLAIWLSMPISDVLCNVASILPLVLYLRFLSKVRDRQQNQ